MRSVNDNVCWRSLHENSRNFNTIVDVGAKTNKTKKMINKDRFIMVRPNEAIYD